MTKPTLLSPAPAKKNRKSLLFSSSILAGVITLGTFTNAVEAQELDLDHDFLQDLYEQYTALNLSTEVNTQPSLENLEDTESISAEIPEEITEELVYIKSQLIKMIELAGGENVLEQLDNENMSIEQLDTVFNALIEQQLISEESAGSTEITAVEESVDLQDESAEEPDETDEIKDTDLNSDSLENEEVDSASEEPEVEDAEEQSEASREELNEVALFQEVLAEEVEEELPSEETSTEEVEEELPSEETSTEEVEEELPSEETPTEEVEEETSSEETPTEEAEKETSSEEAPKEEVKEETPSKDTPKEQPKQEQTTNTDDKAQTYVIKSGDTLNKIAELYNTTTARLASLNNITNINRISVGQVLAINEAGVSEAKTPQPTTPGNLNQATTPTAFINQIAGFAQEVASQNGLYASVMIAQASLESGYGRSSLSAHPNYNLFGIKGSYNGQSVAKQTREYYAHTGWITITDHFKKYPGYEASLNDNARLLRGGLSWNPEFYSGAWIERTNSYRDATAWLQGRYATDPTYASKLNNLIQLYDLTRFDAPAGSVTKPNPAPAPAPNPNPSPSNPSNPFKETTTYTVVRGDTLSKIAREFKTTVQALKTANHLTTDLIFVNQKLTVPKLETAQPAPEQPKEETKPETSKPETGTPGQSTPDESDAQTYTVVSGDNLTKIARRFGTTVNAIRQANNLSADLIFVNQRLTIPVAENAVKPVTPPVDNTNSQSKSITVQRGDTLFQLARTHKTTVAALKSANSLQSDMIFVGQKLLVQGSAEEVVSPPANNNSNDTIKGTTSYTIKSGDTLYRIAREYKTTVSNLRALNNLQSDLIRAGATLTVPTDKPVDVGSQQPVKEQPSETVVYAVKSGNTLSQIARDYKTTVAKLRSDNNLSSDRIFIGQKLTVNGSEIKQEAPAENQSNTVEVDYVVKAGDTLSQIARVHNTTVNELIALNKLEDANRLSIGQRLKVTTAQAEQSKPETSNPAPTVPVQSTASSYTVKAGDTLSQIARTHNMTLNQLRDLNKLENADRIFVGQRLTLSNVQTETPNTTAPTPEPVQTVNADYVVKSGDTLSQIARTHNMTLAQLLEMNKLENADRIFIGQRLSVSTEKSEAPKPVVSTPESAPEPVKTGNGSYTVKSGDTLSQIAQTHNMTLVELRNMNELENADHLSVGQRLVVSTNKTEAPKPAVPAPEPVKSTQTDYVVKSGDTLSQLARDYNVTLSQIKEWNNLTSDVIFVNQTLVLKQEIVSETISAQTEAEHTVSAGDTLSHIAKVYNISIRELKEINHLTSDLIFVNQKLVVIK